MTVEYFLLGMLSFRVGVSWVAYAFGQAVESLDVRVR